MSTATRHIIASATFLDVRRKEVQRTGASVLSLCGGAGDKRGGGQEGGKKLHGGFVREGFGGLCDSVLSCVRLYNLERAIGGLAPAGADARTLETSLLMYQHEAG
jgi:hypothetical protein